MTRNVRARQRLSGLNQTDSVSAEIINPIDETGYFLNDYGAYIQNGKKH